MSIFVGFFVQYCSGLMFSCGNMFSIVSFTYGIVVAYFTFIGLCIIDGHFCSKCSILIEHKSPQAFLKINNKKKKYAVKLELFILH